MECPCSGLLSIHGTDVFIINKAVINILFLETGVLILLGMHVEVRLLRNWLGTFTGNFQSLVQKKKKIPFTFPSAIHIEKNQSLME